MKSVTFIEIDVPYCALTYGTAPCMASIPGTGAIKCFNTIKTCQDSENFDESEVTLRFAKPAAYLPREIDIVADSIVDVSFTPATISLGENLGQRATLNVVFVDHKHSDTGEGFDKYLADRDYNPYERGTFWGKFRARQPFLRGRSIRWITGLEGQDLADMETRNFVVESFDGPTPDGRYTLVAKDILKLVDGDRAQAPVMNTGYLSLPITNNATSLTLAPAGIGDEEYPFDGYLTIAGKEVVSFTRSQIDPAGENDTGTKILLHFDGSNGATTFTDSNFGGSAHAWTTVGSSALSSVAAKFGATSCKFNNSQITTPNHADFVLGTKNWTVDFWYNANGVSGGGFQGLCGQVGTGGITDTGLNIYRDNNNKIVAGAYIGSNTWTVTSTTSINNSAWHFIRFKRDGNSLKLEIDGVQEGGTLAISGAINNSTSVFGVGGCGSSVPNTSSGYIDDFRLSVGVVRSGPPPTAPYTVHSPLVSSGDLVTLIGRGLMNTAASSANAQDRVQLVLRYVSADVADIIHDLMVNYAGVSAGFINLPEWKTETETFLANLYGANICEPTSVATLISELIQQGCLAIWWDDIAQKVRLQVLRAISTTAARFTPDNTLEGSLTTKEQPEKRISRVQTYFGQINPVKSLSDTDNYRSNSLIIDDQAEEDYGGPVIKTIYSRWIPALGRAIADRVGVIQLARFRDPPRRLAFDAARYADTDIQLGGGYRIASHCFQDETGAPVDVPVQVTRLNPPADRFKGEAEEVLFAVPVQDLNIRNIIVDTNTNNINLRDVHDLSYPAPVDGNAIVCRILAGVKVGSSSVSLPALDVGDWSPGVSLKIIVEGTLQGPGGRGGQGYYPGIGAGLPGQRGGTALYTRKAITLELPVGGKLWSGGGGGGGGGAVSLDDGNAGGGGGGAGIVPGLGGGGALGPGATGTETAGGDGSGGINGAYNGARGGDPGLPGAAGASFNAPGGPGGAAGYSIDGASFVTTTVTGGDQRGPTIN